MDLFATTALREYRGEVSICDLRQFTSGLDNARSIVAYLHARHRHRNDDNGEGVGVFSRRALSLNTDRLFGNHYVEWEECVRLAREVSERALLVV